ncbi:helix-turn-helix domain-containing protein [Streptomyces sp. t39]|uniref:MmyB family transcriptional regulator n=1 Tax=Streptomyces sp. t39 TaxID=1828156 RepID=UPI0016506BC8|nr:helix-turn-helix domain-containing protein [Streptomyces sp. t39]
MTAEGRAAGGGKDSLVAKFVRDVRRAQKLTANDLAARIGITPRTLRYWLARDTPWTATEVGRMANALDLNGDNRANLFMLTGHMPPPPPVGELRRTPEMAVYQDLIEGMRHPSVVHTTCWDVVLTNQAFRDVFGSVRRHTMAHPTRNTQRFIFFHPDAPLLLGASDPVAYREQWLMPALAVFSATMEQQPGEPKLLDILAEIRRRPAIHRAYQTVPAWIAANGDIVIKPIPRRFFDPRIGRPVNALIVTQLHLGFMTPALQHSTFTFQEIDAEPEQPPHTQLALFPHPRRRHPAAIAPSR